MRTYLLVQVIDEMPLKRHHNIIYMPDGALAQFVCNGRTWLDEYFVVLLTKKFMQRFIDINNRRKINKRTLSKFCQNRQNNNLLYCFSKSNH